MYKLLLLLVAYGSSAYADQKLQKLSFVLAQMTNAILCNKNCVPAISNDGVNQFVTFSTNLNSGEDPGSLYTCMTNYMINATGDATPSYTTTGNQFALSYIGDYDQYLLPPGPLGMLAQVLQGFSSPNLGGYTCQQYVFQSQSGWIYVALRIPLNGTMESACASVYNYLDENRYLTQTSKKQTKISPTTALLELWSNV